VGTSGRVRLRQRGVSDEIGVWGSRNKREKEKDPPRRPPKPHPMSAIDTWVSGFSSRKEGKQAFQSASSGVRGLAMRVSETEERSREEEVKRVKNQSSKL